MTILPDGAGGVGELGPDARAGGPVLLVLDAGGAAAQQLAGGELAADRAVRLLSSRLDRMTHKDIHFNTTNTGESGEDDCLAELFPAQDGAAVRTGGQLAVLRLVRPVAGGGPGGGQGGHQQQTQQHTAHNCSVCRDKPDCCRDSDNLTSPPNVVLSLMKASQGESISINQPTDWFDSLRKERLQNKKISKNQKDKRLPNKYGTVQELRSTFSHNKSINIDFSLV